MAGNGWTKMPRLAPVMSSVDVAVQASQRPSGENAEPSGSSEVTPPNAADRRSASEKTHNEYELLAAVVRMAYDKCSPSGDHDSGMCASPGGGGGQPLGSSGTIGPLPIDAGVPATIGLERDPQAVRRPDRKPVGALDRQSLDRIRPIE